jgi:YVTN family beta-propeller protein
MLRCIIPVLAVVALAAFTRDEEPLMKLVQTIPLDGVNGRIDHMAVDVEGKRLYVAALGNNSLEVIDVAAGKRIQSIAGLKKPTGIRVLPGKRSVVVASGDDGKVRFYDRDLKLVSTVTGLDDADNVRLDPQGKLIYVGYGDGAIAVIDAQRAEKVGEIKLDGHPEAFAVETNGKRIFVNVPTTRHVAVLDREKHTVIATWPIREAEANFPIALDEANHRLFIGCRKPVKLLVLDSDTGKTVTALDCCGDTDDLFYDPAAKRIYLTGGEGCINVIEQASADQYRIIGTTRTAPGARTSLYVPEMGVLFVAAPFRHGQRAEIRSYALRG